MQNHTFTPRAAPRHRFRARRLRFHVRPSVLGNALGGAIGSEINDARQRNQVYGGTFAEDSAARKAQNPLLAYTQPQATPAPAAEPFAYTPNPYLEASKGDFLANSVAGPGVGIGNLKPLDNRALLNAIERKEDPDRFSSYPSQKPGQVYSPHLTFGDVGQFLSAGAAQAGNSFANFFTDSLPSAASAVVGAIAHPIDTYNNAHPLDALERSGLQTQDVARQAALAARTGDFGPAGALQGAIIGDQVAGFAFAAGTSTVISRSAGFYRSIPSDFGNFALGDGASAAVDFGSISATGAKSAVTFIENALPNAENAVIDPFKITGYALNKDHPIGGNKAIVFESALGYNLSNADDLITKVRIGVTENPATIGQVDKFGKRFTVDIPITGPNGNTVPVRTGFIFDPGSATPRLVTIYVKTGK